MFYVQKTPSLVALRAGKVNYQDNDFLTEAEKIPNGFHMVDVVDPLDFCKKNAADNIEDCILFNGELIRAKHGFGFIFNFTTTEKFLCVFI